MIAIYILREIIRLLLSKTELAFRQIERMTGVSHQSIGNINKRVQRAELALDEVDTMTDPELYQKLYPSVRRTSYAKVIPDFKYILSEVLKRHKNRKSIMVMYIEYKTRYGDKGYERSQFYKLVREHLKASKVTMKQVYLPGEILFIDYAGLTLSYKNDGKDIVLYIFVACMGYSKRRFAFATKDMTSISWCMGLRAAFEYFGKVPEVVQFDNARAMVTTPGQMATFHKNVVDLARHYDCICDTSRVGTPTDNGAAEESVKFITQRILVPMKNDLTFFSLSEVNRHLISEIDKLNNLILQQQDISPSELFFADELEPMKPLPPIPFEPVIFRKEIQTPANYLVRYLGNEYSVPFELAHKRIEVKVKGDKLYVLHQSQIRAIHNIIDGKNNVIRIDEHLKPEHRAELAKSKENFIDWATQIGTACESIVELQYKGLSSPSSRVGGKYCLRLQKLCRKYGEEVFEQACSYAYTHNMSSPNDIELILKAKPFLQDEQVVSKAHTNIRGAGYFGGHQDGH